MKKRSLMNTILRRPNGRWKEFIETLSSECYYCSAKLFFLTEKGKAANDPSSKMRDRRTLDHIVCEAVGGKTDPNNLIPCCATCNECKAELDFIEFSLFAEFYLKPLREMGWKEMGFHALAMNARNEFFNMGSSSKSNRKRDRREQRLYKCTPDVV